MAIYYAKAKFYIQLVPTFTPRASNLYDVTIAMWRAVDGQHNTLTARLLQGVLVSIPTMAAGTELTSSKHPQIPVGLEMAYT